VYESPKATYLVTGSLAAPADVLAVSPGRSATRVATSAVARANLKGPNMDFHLVVEAGQTDEPDQSASRDAVVAECVLSISGCPQAASPAAC
jgi:hypothetical protein